MTMHPFNFFEFSHLVKHTFLSFIVMKIDTKASISLVIFIFFFFFLFGFSPYSSDFELLRALIYLSLYSYGFALRSYTMSFVK